MHNLSLLYYLQFFLGEWSSELQLLDSSDNIWIKLSVLGEDGADTDFKAFGIILRCTCVVFAEQGLVVDYRPPALRAVFAIKPAVHLHVIHIYMEAYPS